MRTKHKALIALALALLIALALALLLVLPLAVWGFRVATAPLKGAGDARIQVHRAENRIAAYDHFFNLCSTVQANEDRLSALQLELDGGPSEARREQIAATMTAIRGARSEDIRRYNADAMKAGTFGQFKASSLPYQLNSSQEETLCDVQ